MAVKTLPQWRADNNLTQSQFGEQVGITTRTISHIENGGNTTWENLRAIYDATDGEVTPNMIVLGKSG